MTKMTKMWRTVISDGDGIPGGGPEGNPAPGGAEGMWAEDLRMWTLDPTLGMVLTGASSYTR